MQFFPAALQNLADQFARLPGIGGKTAQRLAFHVIRMPKEEAQASEIDELVEKKFEGSLPAFIAAFAKRQKLSEKDIKEIQAIIDRGGE